jgi:hypothetical protein
MSERRDNNTVLTRFNRLIEQMANGEMRRHSFRLWEADILLDIMRCNASGMSMPQLLRRYQKAVQRQMSTGSHLQPMKLSEYLESLEVKRARSKPPAPKVRTHTRS